ncbi:ZEP [Symbiodinium natans]|uniref:ZEP protein n=1 Tax=Symbiodinium natans TaxID=878477 RepID=A0A812IE91_9DINO|nr:ZEP [Symbiodinium natans]
MALACAGLSSTQLQAAVEDENTSQAFIDKVCQDTRKRAAEATVWQCTDARELDFAFFTPFPRPRMLLHQAMPVIWLTQLALWPTLLSKFLQMIRCVPMREDLLQETKSVQRLALHPDVKCWKEDHFALVAVAFTGLSLWCVGVPLLLFIQIWKLKDRQDANNYRRYGFFIRGLEPRYWYWDILVKRADTCLMLLVANTSIADDNNAKLLLFPLISGLMLAINNWYKPYSNGQAQILDYIEFILLLTRFVLFSSVSALLIFFPGEEAVSVVGGLLLGMLGASAFYAGLQTLAQALRSSAGLSSEQHHFHGKEDTCSFMLRSWNCAQ